MVTMTGSGSIDLTSIEEDEAYARRLQDQYNREESNSENYDDDDDDDDDDFDPATYLVNVDAIAANAAPGPARVEPFPERFELENTLLDCGLFIKGDVAELHDRSQGTAFRDRRNGDFFVIKSIFEVRKTEEVFFQGYTLRRCTQLAPLFDGKLNDLVLLMDVHRYDKQPFHIQGLKIISVSDVIGKRTCHFTNLPYKEMGLSSTRLHIPKRLADAKNTAAIADHIFNKSPLFCRWVYISIIEPNGRKYGGEARRLYKREVKDFEQLKVSVQRRPPRTPSSSDSNAEDGFSTIKNPRRISAGKRPRSDSIEVLGEDYRKHRPRLPTKVKRLSFFDMFCCAGGASFGAVEAGFVVSFGLEIDKTVIESFKMNHRGAKALLENAHNFPARATRKEYPVDHVHFSTTCKFFSFAHTVPGKDDEKNYDTIFTVGPTLERLKPAYATAEQVPGVVRISKHRSTFHLLLNTIMEAGYNVRFQIIDLAGHQLPQRRLRLLFNMAKVGFPLAPFPNPTNGPPGSGLDRYITIADALKELERIPRGHRNDPLHQPGSQKRYNEKLCDPNITLAKTLTGNGGENFHYSGKRKYTPRENSALQTFPWNASFNGSATSANEQIGNAYPCKPAAQHFLASAQTHEAFEAGFIDGEEDIRDLWETLNDKGINIAKEDTRYRYLTRLEKNKARPSYVPDCILARELKIGPLRFRHRPDVTMPPSRGRNRPQQLPVRAETVEDGRVVYWVPDDDD